MSKIFFQIIFPITFLLFILAKPSYALVCPSENCNVYHEPNPVHVNDDKIFVYIITDTTLSDTETYTFRAWPQSKNEFECGIGGATNAKTSFGAIDKAKRSDGSVYELIANWEISKCAEEGNWNFKLWVGSSSTGPSDDSGWLVKNYSFEMEAAGGEIPKIEPQRPSGKYALAEDPYVKIINARTTQTYTFWWENELTQRDIAAKFTAGTTKNPAVKLTRTGILPGAGDRTLCMAIGNFPTALFLKCDKYKTVFHFTVETVPSGENECSIDPANPNDSDDITLTGLNITPQKRYRADLEKDGTIDHKGSLFAERDVVGPIPLGSKLARGNYKAVLYKEEGSSWVCEKEFTVGAKAAATFAPVAKATCDPSKVACSTAGGNKCASGDTGIQTAIGCIHTAPLVLVKDLLTFMTAIAGGLAFLMMLLGAFQMLTSAGNPDTLQAGKDRMTNAIIGLLFIIFAVLLMQIIGVDILGILPK